MTLSEEEGEPSRITAPLGSAKLKDDITEQPSKKERKKVEKDVQFYFAFVRFKLTKYNSVYDFYA